MATDKTGAEASVADNPSAQRYDISVDGTVAGFAEYRDREVDGTPERIFFHTEVADEFGGRGLATILVKEALDDTRATGRVIVGVCPLVAAYLKKNPDFAAEAARAVTPETLEWLRANR